MTTYEYQIDYEYYQEDEARAWACQGFLELMRKFKIVVTMTDVSISHVGDITLTVGYRYQSRPSLKTNN